MHAMITFSNKKTDDTIENYLLMAGCGAAINAALTIMTHGITIRRF